MVKYRLYQQVSSDSAYHISKQQLHYQQAKKQIVNTHIIQHLYFYHTRMSSPHSMQYPPEIFSVPIVFTSLHYNIKIYKVKPTESAQAQQIFYLTFLPSQTKSLPSYNERLYIKHPSSAGPCQDQPQTSGSRQKSM